MTEIKTIYGKLEQDVGVKIEPVPEIRKDYKCPKK